jgi:hypothetical protein
VKGNKLHASGSILGPKATTAGPAKGQLGRVACWAILAAQKLKYGVRHHSSGMETQNSHGARKKRRVVGMAWQVAGGMMAG